MLPFDGMPKRFSRFYAIFTKDEAFESKDEEKSDL